MGRPTRRELSQEEIWDDSALVDSWNDAYEEYKYYHSIHARGEKVEAVLANHDEAVKSRLSSSSLPPMAESVTVEDGNMASSNTTYDEAKVNLHADTQEPAETASVSRPVQSGRDAQPIEATITATANVPTQEPTTSDGHEVVDIDANIQDRQSGQEQSNSNVVRGHSAGLAAALDAGVQDPALKNLMMSWYWAGYYTGLHQGKQQQQQGSE